MTRDPSPDVSSAGAGEDLVFRRGKLRKRDDPAVDLFQEAQAGLSDIARVKRILLELGRLYNPVTNGPILELAHRRRVVERLEAGAPEDARQILEQCLRDYTRAGNPAGAKQLTSLADQPTLGETPDTRRSRR